MTERAAEAIERLYAQALAAHEQGDVATAVELYSRILAQFPDADAVLYNQGLALFSLERFAEAAKSFAHAAELRREDDPGYIAETARRCGWQVLRSEEADLRREADAWVRGDLFALLKKAGEE